MKLPVVQEERTSLNFNFYRKTWHSLGILVPLFLYFNVFSFMNAIFVYPTRTTGFLLLGLLILLLLIMDIFRIYHAGFRKFFYQYFGSLMKVEESERFNATIPYFLANMLLFSFFSVEVVMIACIFLVLGDPMAAYFGGKYGRIRFWNGKSLEGLIAFLGSGFLCCLLFLGMHTALGGGPLALLGYENNISNEISGVGIQWSVVATVFLGAVVAALMELVSWTGLRGFMDDNILVPLAGALGVLGFGTLLFGLPPEDFLFEPGRILDIKGEW